MVIPNSREKKTQNISKQCVTLKLKLREIFSFINNCTHSIHIFAHCSRVQVVGLIPNKDSDYFFINLVKYSVTITTCASFT